MARIADHNKELYMLATAQQGFFTAKQAEIAGFTNKNHSYHLKAGHWVREARGIYRLSFFPRSADEQKIIFALWSQNRNGDIQGVYSHETALAHYDLSDMNPSKLHMTVPTSFRRNSKIPKILKLHYADLTKEMILQSRGFLVTKPTRTISDAIQCGWIPFDIIRQTIFETLKKGLMQKREMESMINHVQVSKEIQQQLLRLLKEIRK